jgi:hypothetical protein
MRWNSVRQIHFFGSDWSQGGCSDCVVSDMRTELSVLLGGRSDGELAGTELNGEKANDGYRWKKLTHQRSSNA